MTRRAYIVCGGTAEGRKAILDELDQSPLVTACYAPAPGQVPTRDVISACMSRHGGVAIDNGTEVAEHPTVAAWRTIVAVGEGDWQMVVVSLDDVLKMRRP